jgi:AraC-like DNA-binding protein
MSMHDGIEGLVTPSNIEQAILDAICMRTASMTGPIMFHGECTAPWAFTTRPLHQIARLLVPGADRLVTYHLLTEGCAVVRLDGAAEVPVGAGDMVIIPHGDSHTLANGASSKVVDDDCMFRCALTGGMRALRLGGGGDLTRIVGGCFGCDSQAGRLFLAGLPSVIKVSIRSDAAGQWLESSIRYLVREVALGRLGATTLLSKMAEALVIEALRRYLKELPPEQTSWLAGAKDPIVGRALALLHQRPSHRWTLAELAVQVGASRSVLAERFTRLIGEPPLSYLAHWRLHLAARQLQTSHNTILQVALDVGYDSEAAFNRAFKREFALPPARYRKKHGGNSRVDPSRSLRASTPELRPAQRG